MRRSAANGNATTPPRKRPPWNCHQSRTPSGGSASMLGTPRACINKENLPDDSAASVSNSSIGLSLSQPAASPAGPVNSASTGGGNRRPANRTQSARQHQQQPAATSTPPSQEFEVTTCSGLLKEVLASAAASQKQKQQQQSQRKSSSASSPDHVIAIRELAAQLAVKVAHRPDCLALLSELESRLDQLAADIGVVAGQLRDENRVLRRRIRQLESAVISSQSEATAATTSQSEATTAAARREWGRREAQLLARLQAAESARGRLETRTAALETELRDMARLSNQISVVSNGASNAPAAVAAVASPGALTAANLARHTNRQRVIEMEAAAAATAFDHEPAALNKDDDKEDEIDDEDYAITSVSQQHRRPAAASTNQRVLPPPAATSSPPTLDTAPAPHLVSVPARYARETNSAGLFDGENEFEDDLDGSLDEAEDEAEFRRGLARIEEQIARLQDSLGATSRLTAS